MHGVASVTCPSDLPVAIGGGGWSPVTSDVLAASMPLASNGATGPSGATGTAEVRGGASGWQIRYLAENAGSLTTAENGVYVYAICAP